MRRRSLLWGGLAACLATPAAKPEPALLSLFRDKQAAARLGRAYLEGRPSADLASLEWPSLPAGGALRRRVARQIRADFAAGRVVCVQGWLLSETEARICAMAALA